jgi:hypothetical protein
MNYEVSSIKEYMEAIPKERKESIEQLRETIKKNLPKGFDEVFQYQMISYVVPLSTYPKGYHVEKNTTLVFLSLASQKRTINLYHSGVYAKKELHDWFVDEYQRLFSKKPNMGKSCIRFQKVNEDVLTLVGDLVSKMSVNEYIKLYEDSRRK